MPDVALLGFSFLLGAQAFFSPCGFPMLPAYLAYYLPRADERAPRAAGLLRGLGGGALAALGAFALVAAVGALAVALGAPFKARVVDLELAGALVVLLLGALTLAGKGPRFRVALAPSQRRSAWALVGFGALYAAVAASCVAPVFLAVLVQAFASATAWDGALVVLAYAAGLCAMLVAVTVLVATAQTALVARLKRALPWMEKASGAVMLLVGLYLLLYWARQAGL